LKQGFSNIDNIDQLWLMMLVGGFLAIWLGVFSSHMAHQLFESYAVSDSLGVIGNYVNFIFINSLVVYNLVNSNVFQGINEESPKEDAEALATNTQHVQALLDAMKKDELYLNPELTLEDLANHTSFSTRSVSAMINSQLDKNFFEFVNEFRVAKAQSLLAEQHSTVPMSKVMEESGFNSKATFNRFFKRSTSMTPTEYRNKCSKNQLVKQSGFSLWQRV
jgi:AraC-like DNA-binding protein